MSAPHADDFLERYLARHAAFHCRFDFIPAWVVWLAALLALVGGLASLHLGLGMVSLGLCMGAFALAGAVDTKNRAITISLLMLSVAGLVWQMTEPRFAGLLSGQPLMTGLGMLTGHLIGRVYALRSALARSTTRNRLLAQFSDVILHLEDGCLKEIDLQGRLKSMNVAGQALMEVCDFAPLHDSNWLEFWPADSRRAVKHAFAEAREGRSGRFSGFCPTLAGTPKWWEVLVVPIFDLKGEVESILALSWDVSDLQNSFEKLKTANHTFQDLLESLNDGFFCVDRKGRFLQLNSKAEELLGHKADELLEMTFQEAFPDALVGDFALASCDVLEFGIPRHFEAYFEPLKKWCRVDAYPKPEGIYVFFSDITAQVKALQQSQAAETRLRLTQKVAGFADWQFDLATNELILSQQAASLLGVESLTAEFTKDSWLRQMHPDDRLALVSALLDLNEGKTFLSVQARFRDTAHADTWRDFQLLGELLKSQAHSQGLLVGCMQDVSVQKQRERRLVDAEAYAKSVIDAVPQPFCVLDEAGDILSTNQAWINHFQLNDDLQAWTGIGSSYFELCNRASLRGDSSGSELSSRIEALLSGTGDPFTLEYVANLAKGQQIFQVNALPMATERRQFLVMHEDITQQHELVAKLQASETRFREMVEYLPHVYWVYDVIKSGFSYVSPALEKIWDMAPHYLYEDVDAWLYLVHPDDKAQALAFQNNLLTRHEPAEVEYRALDASGRVYWVRNRAFPFYDVDGKAERIVGIAEDVTEARTYRDRLVSLEQLDAMSGLPNEVLFSSRLEVQCAQAKQANQEFLLVLLSLDRLKWVRQCFGQQVKQDLVGQITLRLQTALNGRGYLARISSDEFAILLSREEDVTHYPGVVQALLDEFKQHFTLGEELVTLTACIGVARFPADGDNEEVLIKSATAAAYTVQQAGLSGYQCFTPGLLQSNRDALRLETELHRGLEKQEFVLYYQPKLDLHSQRICGAEALIRWNHPVHGLVSPLRFVPLLEQSGLIVQVGLWCIHQALSQLALWQRQQSDGFVVAVNLSLKQLQPGLVGQVESALQRYGIAAECLELELTESIMHEAGKTVEIISELKALGVRIAVDDFGTGYSTLSSIRSFVPNTVKIDRCFLRDLESSPSDVTIVRSVIEMAHSLGMVV
ncbi:EAL domain-containing protein, partial [Halomonas sp. BBD48]|nr:EAL domain-containing protein [Halomonas sp. BBD48]